MNQAGSGRQEFSARTRTRTRLGLERGLGLGLVVLHYVTMAVVLGALVYLDELYQPPEEACSERVVAPLIRVTTFFDQRAEATAIAACEEILRILEPFRDQETSPLGQEQLNRLDASCRTIEAQMRSPNVAILSAAIEDAISVVRPFLEFADEPRSEAARNVVDATTGIGDIDPAVSGEHSRDALQHAVDLHVPDLEHDPEVPPTNTTEPSESTETSSDNQSFSDQARERARAGVLEGIQELSKRVIVNGPANAATITAIVAAWLTQPPGTATGVSVAIAVIKFLLGANRRK